MYVNSSGVSGKENVMRRGHILKKRKMDLMQSLKT